MANLRLTALTGPLSGQIYSIRDGLKIGRTRGDILLDDAKVSNLHGFFVFEKDGVWLQDNGSKNGIRVAGERVARLQIRPGIKFEIGNTEFEVSDLSASMPQKSSPPPLGDSHEPVLQSEQSPITTASVMAEDPKSWSECVKEALANALASASELTNVPSIGPLLPPLKLLFVGGGQTETEWIIGYGPRVIGSKSADLPIFEPGAPEKCFQLSPSDNGVLFETSHPEKVRINKASQTKKVLSPGDVISIGDTIIEVKSLP